MASNGRWSRHFDDPIPLPGGRALVTLQCGAVLHCIAPQARHKQNAARRQLLNSTLTMDQDAINSWLRLASIRHEANTSKAEARSLARLD